MHRTPSSLNSLGNNARATHQAHSPSCVCTSCSVWPTSSLPLNLSSFPVPRAFSPRAPFFPIPAPNPHKYLPQALGLGGCPRRFSYSPSIFKSTLDLFSQSRIKYWRDSTFSSYSSLSHSHLFVNLVPPPPPPGENCSAPRASYRTSRVDAPADPPRVIGEMNLRGGGIGRASPPPSHDLMKPRASWACLGWHDCR